MFLVLWYCQCWHIVGSQRLLDEGIELLTLSQPAHEQPEGRILCFLVSGLPLWSSINMNGIEIVELTFVLLCTNSHPLIVWPHLFPVLG